jgi:hypothetical protein
VSPTGEGVGPEHDVPGSVQCRGHSFATGRLSDTDDPTLHGQLDDVTKEIGPVAAGGGQEGGSGKAIGVIYRSTISSWTLDRAARHIDKTEFAATAATALPKNARPLIEMTCLE